MHRSKHKFLTYVISKKIVPDRCLTILTGIKVSSAWSQIFTLIKLAIANYIEQKFYIECTKMIKPLI